MRVCASYTDGATGWLHVCSEAYSCVVTRYCKVLCEGCHMSPWVFPSHKIDNRKRKNVWIFRIHTCTAFAQTRTQSETDGGVLRLNLSCPFERYLCSSSGPCGLIRRIQFFLTSCQALEQKVSLTLLSKFSVPPSTITLGIEIIMMKKKNGDKLSTQNFPTVSNEVYPIPWLRLQSGD